jgi:transposase
MNTKLHAVTDTNSRPVRLFITAGQVSDYTGAAALMNGLPEAEWFPAPSHRNYVSTAGQWTEDMMLTGSAKPL